MVANRALPGPKGRFLLGNLREFNQDTLQFLLDQRQYGDITQFKFGPFPVLIANHPDYFHDVLVTNADKYYKSSATKQIMAPIIGNGLFTSDGEFWKRQRKLVQPVFHSKRIGAYADTMVEYANDLATQWQKGGTRAIEKEMTTLTMRIIAKTLFDADVTQESDEVGMTIRRALQLVDEGFRQIFPLPLWIPTAHNRRMKLAADRLSALIQGFIDDRRASGLDKGDFLSLLLSAQDDENHAMTDKQVRDEAMTLFGAGHETTAVTMTWIWYLLSKNADAEAKLHDELARVLAGRLPTLDDLPQLPYTEMIVKEAMRLYPAAWSLTREAHEPAALGGYPVKKGQIVILNTYGLQRDARYFAEPDRFIPERFNAENEKAIPKYTYMPFGGGPRVCIGNAFSMMESRLLLATLAQRYQLAVAPNFDVIPDRQFTLKPKYGIQMIVTARETVHEGAV